MIRGIIFPTQDGMGTGGDGARDLGEMGVHRLGVDGGQDQARSGTARGADGTEQIRPLIAGIARCARSAAALGPDARQRALLADPRVRRENSPPDCFLARLTPGTRSQAACPAPARGPPQLPLRGSFFERRLRLRVRFRVLGAHRQPPKSQRRQLLADRPLMQGNAELGLDAALQIAAPPAHHDVARRVGTGFDPGRKLGQLLRHKPPGPLRHRPVHQAGQALAIVTVNPFTGETVPRTVS